MRGRTQVLRAVGPLDNNLALAEPRALEVLSTKCICGLSHLFIYIFWPRILVPRPDIDPGPQQWKGRVLTTALPGNPRSHFQLAFLLLEADRTLTERLSRASVFPSVRWMWSFPRLGLVVNIIGENLCGKPSDLHVRSSSAGPRPGGPHECG